MNSRAAAAFATLLAILTTGCGSPSDLPEVRLERAVLLQERGEYEEAIRVYTSLADELSSLADLDHNRGYCYEQLGLTAKAIENYQRCLTKDPQHVSALNNLAAILARQENYDEAAELFTRILRYQPDTVLALRNRGLSYSDGGRRDDALTDYNAALKLAPEDPQVLFQRGNLYVLRQEPELAIADYSAAIQSDSGFAHAWLNRGLAHHQLDHDEEARRDLQRASELDSNIVLAGMNWFEQQAEEIREIAPVGGPDWNTVHSSALLELQALGYKEIRIIRALEDELSAVFHGTRNGTTSQIWVCVQHSPTAVFPVVELAPVTSLLVLEADSKAAGGLTVASWRDTWDPGSSAIPADVIRVDLAEPHTELQLVPQSVDP